MIKRILFLLVVSSIYIASTKASPIKRLPTQKLVLNAQRASEHIKVDGELDEAAWQQASVAEGFSQYEPFNGSYPSERTEVRIMYDDNAIYVGASLYDDEPDKIYKELGKRDNSDKVRSDAFSMLISPYNDGINYLEFIVSASGVQTDIRHTGSNSDRSWNAVWQSAVTLNGNGWFAEIRIPFSALRFSKGVEGNWGLNFRRLIKRYNEWSSWNPIDNSIAGIVNQSGELAGIKDIKPPVRLSFMPYVSSYVDKLPDNESLTYSFNGGMDVQLGLSESFTLDMTLIPDFKQVKSDEKVLNISPFEVQYGEQRPFFNEGMDLFDKGGIFYSRRIGTTPKGFAGVSSQLNPHEAISSNPRETSMINASKITGRTANGLGIGVLNALTSKTYATFVDSITGSEREVLTQGFTNYNMLVFDQTLPNNSYVSLINTNLTIPEQNYVSNVTATDFHVRNRKNMYALSGKGVISQIYNSTSDIGYKYVATFEKNSGSLLYKLWTNTESKRYNPNDMGYLQAANEFSNGFDLGYRIYKPFWKLLNWNSWFGGSYTTLHNPMAYNSSNLYLNIRTTYAKTYHTFGIDLWMDPIETHDYYETRVEGRMVIKPRRFFGGFFTSSDYRKMLAIDTRAGYWRAESMGKYSYYASFSPRIRLSDNVLIVYQVRQDFEANNTGYVSRTPDDAIIYMGLRDVSTLTNTIDGLFAFNANASLNLTLRHYWRWLDYSSYHTLNLDGTLSDKLAQHSFDRNTNYNAFNIDLSYQWNFAPGSLLSVVWKNEVSLQNKDARSKYFDNINGLMDQNQANSVSLRVLYYLDYNSLRKGRRG